MNTKIAFIGGEKYTPIDLEESIKNGWTVQDETKLFSEKSDDIFKMDLGVGLRRNKPNSSNEIKLEVMNVTNNQAKVDQYYNETTEAIEYSYQWSLLPVLSYKVKF